MLVWEWLCNKQPRSQGFSRRGTLWQSIHAQIQRGQGGQTPSLKNHKNIGLLRNTGPDPLKSQSYQASIQCWAIIGLPARRRFASGLIMAPALSGIWILSPPHQLKNNKKKRFHSSVWTPSDKTFWISTWYWNYLIIICAV